MSLGRLTTFTFSRCVFLIAMLRCVWVECLSWVVSLGQLTTFKFSHLFLIAMFRGVNL